MNFSHKISEFRPPFSREQRKTKLAQSQNMCTTLICTFLRNTEQISDILLYKISYKKWLNRPYKRKDPHKPK